VVLTTPRGPATPLLPIQPVAASRSFLVAILPPRCQSRARQSGDAARWNFARCLWGRGMGAARGFAGQPAWLDEVAPFLPADLTAIRRTGRSNRPVGERSDAAQSPPSDQRVVLPLWSAGGSQARPARDGVYRHHSHRAHRSGHLTWRVAPAARAWKSSGVVGRKGPLARARKSPFQFMPGWNPNR
jgi:hypothetical protein